MTSCVYTLSGCMFSFWMNTYIHCLNFYRMRTWTYLIELNSLLTTIAWWSNNHISAKFKHWSHDFPTETFHEHWHSSTQIPIHLIWFNLKFCGWKLYIYTADFVIVYARHPQDFRDHRNGITSAASERI